MSSKSVQAPEPTRFNELQIIGSHNSYKKAIDPDLLTNLALSSPEHAQALDYGHMSLREQLDMGLRNLELDVFHDPDGGRFAEPQGLRMIARPAPYDADVMRVPGFKVMHVQDIDFRSHCQLLRDCLAQLNDWSQRNPDHVPLVITINAKDAALDQPGFATPLEFDAAAWQALDQALRRGLGPRLFEPDALRGEADSLPAAIAQGWPTLAQMRGKFLVVLDQDGEKRTSYTAGHPALRGRAMFVNAPAGTPESAVLIINDPVARFDEISAAVEQGYLVRTRADADTLEARTGNYTRMRRAFASGAQVVTTDYYAPETRFGHNFRVRFPGGSYVRCNPVLRPDCELKTGAASALAGTEWRLVDFLSMDDAIGRIEPADDVLYTLHLHADGTVSMRLNCNRAQGSWQAEPSGSHDSGGILFGTLASTNAFCPPPNMDVRVTRDMNYVRSFVLRDGNLYLSLYADGGIYQFEPYAPEP